jgi:predicted membrane protein
MHGIRDYQGRIFSGLLIILIGVLFLLGNLGKLDIGEVFSTYWPLILVFIGLWHLIAYEFRRTGLAVILILIGVFFMLVNLDLIRGRVWIYFWPLLIIAVGLWLIFRPRFKPLKEKAPEIKEKDLDAFIIFSGIKRRFSTPEFRGGKATAIFGGVDLDFTQAGLAENKATIELTAVFGGIEVLAPNDWEVVVDSSSIFGGVEDKRKAVPPAETKATLFVRATAIFGGIEIK